MLSQLTVHNSYVTV